MGLTQVKTSGIADDAVTQDKVANDAIDLTEIKAGVDGKIISYDASGNPVAVGPGSDGQVLTSTGDGSPPAFEDLPASGPSLSGSTDNTIVTVTGANAMQGEANLTFANSGSDPVLTVTNSGHPQLNLTTTGTTDNCSINFGDSEDADAGEILYANNGNTMRFYTAGAERLRIENAGDVKIDDGNLVIGTSGHGIDFSAETNSSESGVTVEDEVLDHYEKGTWTPFFFGSTTAGTFSVSVRPARYVRIGDLVWINMYIQGGSLSGAAGDLKIGGLPFDIEGSPDCAMAVAYANGFSEMPDNTVLLIINGGSNTLRVMKTAAHYAGNTSGLADSSDSMAIVIGGCYSVA